MGRLRAGVTFNPIKSGVSERPPTWCAGGVAGRAGIASRRRAFLGRQQAIAIGLAAVDIAVTTWNGRGPGN